MSSWFRSLSRFFLVLFLCVCINHAASKSETEDDSYTKHCSSMIPPYNITVRSDGNSLPSLSTSYFTGEDSLLPRIASGRKYYYAQKTLRLRFRQDHFETTAAGVYVVQGFLYIRFPYSSDDAPANYSSYGGYNRHSRNRASWSLRFPMNGLWSDKSRKLCMVGSAAWRGIDRHAVLKLKFDEENPTIYTGIVSGSLESTASSATDPAYFEPILIFNFLEVSNYRYSLLPKGEFPIRKDESSLSLDATEFCSEMAWGLRLLGLEYAAECRGRHCSPFGNSDSNGSLPRFISLAPIQCDKGAKKARFVATFQNHSSYRFNSFPLASTAIGEASWDEKNNRIIGVACPISNPSLQLGNAVGDCTITFTLWKLSVLTIRNTDSRISGEIWSSDEDFGYSRKINLTATNENHVVVLPDQRYQYTELDRARSSCTAMKRPSKKGEKYPDGESLDMGFDFNIKNGNGDGLARASATPVWVDDHPYQGGIDAVYASGPVATVTSDAVSQKRADTKMSYEIRIRSFHSLRYTNTTSSLKPSLDWPVMSNSHRIVITAEGLYDAENGHLCMVGCRRLVAPNSMSTFKDCEIVVELKVPPVNGKRGGLIKGILRSTRPNTDALYFDDLVIESSAYNRRAAERSVWRMDMEIAMVLASNTLICIFVALQIFHVKRNPEVTSLASLVMAAILVAGNIIPLMVNFEAVFLGYHDKKTLRLGSGGRLEANEVAVRIITMIALLLQLRLLQLVYTAKQSDDSGKNSWSVEKRAGFVSFALYILGGLLTLLLNSMRSGRRYSVWGDLRSYAGLIIDGFLLPQILLNIFGGFAEKALCHSFYIGTSAVRLLPHAYNQYRAHNYPKFDIKGTYYYANPAADLYSTAWDIVIPCGIISLAVIVFMQQRCRFVQVYENVPTTADNP